MTGDTELDSRIYSWPPPPIMRWQGCSDQFHVDYLPGFNDINQRIWKGPMQQVFYQFLGCFRRWESLSSEGSHGWQCDSPLILEELISLKIFTMSWKAMSNTCCFFCFEHPSRCCNCSAEQSRMHCVHTLNHWDTYKESWGALIQFSKCILQMCCNERILPFMHPLYQMLCKQNSVIK